MQEARIAFICHLRKIDDVTQVLACNMDILQMLWDYWVEMAPVHIPRAKYKNEIVQIHKVSLDEPELSEKPVLSDDVIAVMVLKDFLSKLTPEERTVVLMKLDGLTGREIMPHVNLTTDVQMSRLLQRIRRKAMDYFFPEKV